MTSERRWLESKQAASRIADLQEVLVEPGTRVEPDAPISRVIEALLERPQSRVAHVVGAQDRLLGTVSWRSVLQAANARLGVREDGVLSIFSLFRELRAERARDVMRAPVTALMEETLRDVLLKMQRFHENDVAVVDGSGKLLGEVNGMRVMRMALKTFQDTEAALDEARKGT